VGGRGDAKSVRGNSEGRCRVRRLLEEFGARLGESQRAIETLRQAIAGGYESFGWMKHDPDLDTLRDDPAFIALMPAEQPAG
jgi:hypothetical protein